MKNPNLAPAAPETEAPTQNARDAALESLRVGKDEMNLVEYPIAVLTQQRGGSGVREIRWEQTHPRTGKKLAALWRVQGGAQTGLPGPNEDKLYLVLMELWREQGQHERVYFAQADILRRMNVATNARGYGQLRDWFERLGSVRVRADNCFWKPEIQNYAQSFQFGILGPVDLVPEPPGRKGQKQMPLSSFVWYPEFAASLRAGNIRSIDLDFAFSLQLPLSLKLFRYLDKHRYGKTGPRRGFEIELHKLCEVHLGMTASPYASKLKERLAGAHHELIERAFLASVTYRKMRTSDGEKVCYAFSPVLAPEPLDLEAVGVAETALEGLLAALPAATRAAPAERSAERSAERTAPGRAVDSAAVLGGFLLADEEARAQACDAVFESLDATEQTRIKARVKADLAPFLQENMNTPGARGAMSRGIRKEIEITYPNEMQKEVTKLS